MKSLIFRPGFLPGILLPLLLASGHKALALDLIWSKTAGNSFWSTAANWTTGVPPSTSRTTDTLTFNGGSTFGGPVNNDISNLEIATLSIVGSFNASSSSKLTGQPLRINDLDVRLNTGGEFVIENGLTLTGTPSFGWDSTINNSGTGFATLRFEGGVDAGPFLLEVRGNNKTYFNGGLSASNRSIGSTFFRVNCTNEGEVRLPGTVATTGQIELERGRLIMPGGAPQARIRLAGNSARVFESKGVFRDIHNLGGSLQFLSGEIPAVVTEVTGSFISGNAPGGFMVFRPFPSGLVWNSQKLVLKGTEDISQTALSVSAHTVSGGASLNAPPLNSEIVIIDRQISGSFSGNVFENVANNGFIANHIGDVIYQLRQNRGDGNDVTITRVATVGGAVPLPTISSIAVSAIAGNTTQRRVTITGKAVGFQKVVIQSSATTASGFTDVATIQASETGTLSASLIVPIATTRQFYRFRTVAAPAS